MVYSNSMKRYIAIGDIHGCRMKLEKLLEKISFSQKDRLIFLGDYIDRGKDSKGVLKFLIELKKAHPSIIFLRGNHESLLLKILFSKKLKSRVLEWYFKLGGIQTFNQYGLPIDKIVKRMYFTADYNDPNFSEYFPKDHIEFLKNTSLYYKTDDYLFVHAGIDPSKKFCEQTEESFLWIRYEFIDTPHNLPQTVVYGHTTTSGFTPCEDLKERKIGIDTGAVYGGKLTALILPEMEYVSVS